MSDAARLSSGVAKRFRTARGRRFAVGVGAATMLTYVTLVDPHRSRAVRPRCPIKLVTGLDCPACGGMRLAYDVVHGDSAAAVHDNAFLLMCSPLLLALLWRSAGAHATDAPVSPRVAYGLGVAALVWMVMRNMPAWKLKPIVR